MLTKSHKADGRFAEIRRWPNAGMWKSIWNNSWPMLGIMGLNFLIGYTDIYVAGLLGPEVQAAVGFISQQYFVLIILGNALGVGTVALVSKAVGRKRWDDVFDLTRQSLMMVFTLGILLSAAALLGSRTLIEAFDLPPSVRPIALTYLKIFSLALCANYLIIMANAVFRATGKPSIAFQIMTFIAVLNIAGDFIFVFGFGFVPPLGYPGIALSTACSMTVGVGLALLFLTHSRWRAMWRGPWHWSRSTLGGLCRISWPAAVLQIAWNAGTLVLYHYLSQLGAASVTAMAAYANGLRVEAIIYLPAFALNMAAAVLVGQSLGAGSLQRAKQIGWRMAGTGAVILSAMGALLFWMAPDLAGMLTAQPEVLDETVRYLRINLLSVPFMTYSIVLGGAMQGAGDTRGVMKIIALAIWVVRIPLAAVLCFTLGMQALGIWVAMLASMSLQGLLMIWRFSSGSWGDSRSEAEVQTKAPERQTLGERDPSR